MPVQRLEKSILSSAHNWNLEREVDPCFHTNVENNASPRADMRRYMAIMHSERQHAKDCFSKLCKTGTIFRVPSTLRCDRTFARDAEEAYYLDMMDQYLRSSSKDLDIRDIPLLKRRTQSRLFNKFGRRPGYHRELYDRRRVGRWLPFDAFENKHFTDASLSEWDPMIEEWLKEVVQPPAMPVPSSLVAYYFHTELRNAQIDKNNGVEISERAKRLLFCLEMEYYILMLATWWNEASRGGKQFIMDLRCIEVLERHCRFVTDIAGKPAQAITELMRCARFQPSCYHNWLTFEDDCLEDSTFLWSVEKTGVFDAQERSRRQLFCSRFDRGITTKRFSSSLFKRSSLLEKKLTGPDLGRIPGLRDIIGEQGWETSGEMRICDVIGNLVNPYHSTRGVMNKVLREAIQPLRACVIDPRYSFARATGDHSYRDRDYVPRLEYEASYSYNRERNDYRHGRNDYIQDDRWEYYNRDEHRNRDNVRYNRDVYDRENRNDYCTSEDYRDHDYGRDDRDRYDSAYKYRAESRDGYHGMNENSRECNRDLGAPALEKPNQAAEEVRRVNGNVPLIQVLSDGARTPTPVVDSGPVSSSQKVPVGTGGLAPTMKANPILSLNVDESNNSVRAKWDKLLRSARKNPAPISSIHEFTPTRPFLTGPPTKEARAQPTSNCNSSNAGSTQEEERPSDPNHMSMGGGNAPWRILTRSAAKRAREDATEQRHENQRMSKKAKKSR